ncbi:helix-turn-helix domain-containing protein [Butyricicoccus sp.]|uniref:helix-turn-helix domain-containing protein n=1 Tax=Butyricicoccus sp. TaxID=2049021 RepID=UPI0037365804
MNLDKQYQQKYQQLGLNIAYYRKRRGMSQIRLAERVGISRTHMSRIETAECAVSLDVIFSICAVLDISPARLFDFR